jgi:DNA-binding MarR family transcriptional regulator
MSDASSAAALLFLREEELAYGLELLFFADRDLARDSDAILAAHGLARGHGRVIHFVGRTPNITMSALLDILYLTKQSLSRLVQDLSERKLIRQKPGQQDRRQRQLTLTEDGRALERLLWDQRRKRIAKAYRASGPQSVEGFRRVLLGLIDPPQDERSATAPRVR